MIDRLVLFAQKIFNRLNILTKRSSFRRGAIVSVSVFIVLLSVFQLFFPNGSGTKAYATSLNYSWPTNAAFTSATTNSNIDFATTPNSVQQILPGGFNPVGDGHDGPLTVSSSFNLNTQTNAYNGRTQPDGYVDRLLGFASNQVCLASTPSLGTFVAGDEIIIISVKGSPTTNVGKYEFLKVQSITTNCITTVTPKVNFYGDGASDDNNVGTNQFILVQRVPNYTSLTINSGQTLTASAWNGTKGGVVAFRANGTVTNNGTVSVLGLGHRGGAAGSLYTQRAQSGEWYGGGLVASGGTYNTAGLQVAGAGGGGGGVYETTGYSGGSSSTNSPAGGGGGGAYSNVSWRIEASGYGGGAGHGTVGSGGSNMGSAPGANGSGANSGNGANGISGYGGSGGGGGAYGDSSQLNNKAYFGAGGGASGGFKWCSAASCPQAGNGTLGYAGYNGGGIIFIGSDTLSNLGTITADAQGSGDWGNYGAGGSLILNTRNYSNSGSISTKGTPTPFSGPGGGNGRSIISYLSYTGNDPANSVFYKDGRGYQSPATLGGSAAGNVGLKLDTGVGVYAHANTLTWTATTASAGQKVLFKVRVGNTQAELDANQCYGPTTLDSGCADWTTAGKFFSQVYNAADPPNPTKSATTIASAIPAKRYIEVLVRLESNGGNTPVLSLATLNYDSLEAPTSPKQYKSDATEINVTNTNGYTNESSAALKTDVPSMAGIPTETLIPQVEVVSPSSASFTGNAGTPAGVTYSAANISYTANTPITGADIGNLHGLSPGSSYKWQVRLTDGSGRVGPWSATSNSFTVEQTAPTISSFAVASGSGSSNYVNGSAGDRILKFSGVFNDAGGSSGTLKVQFSQDGTNWGVINNTNDGNLTSAGWTNYTTITANAASQNIINGTSGAKTWYLTGGDQSGYQLYVRTMDMARNTSGQWLQSSKADFDSGTVNPAGSVKTFANGLRLGGGSSGQATLRPDGVGSQTESSAYPGTPNWTVVNDVTPSDDSYLYSSGLCGDYCYTADLYSTSHSIPPGSTINAVTIYFRSTSYMNPASPLIKDSTGVWTGPEYINSSGFQTDSVTRTTRANGTPWTLTDIDNLEIGASVFYTSDYSSSLVSQIYAVVDWESPPPPYIASGNLISPVKNSGSAVNYGRIFYQADVPSQAGANAVCIKADANNDNSTWNFTGPAGTTDAADCYANGQQLRSGLNQKQYFKYQAALMTANTSYTPAVYEVNTEITTKNPASNTLALDTVAPAGTVTVGSGNPTYATSRAVTLYLDPTNPGSNPTPIADFQLSNDGINWGKTTDASGNITDTGWATWSTNYNTGQAGYPWNLAGSDGAKVVYVKYRDAAVNLGGDFIQTVTIGSQQWMKANLNVGARVNGSSNQSLGQKYCFNDDENNCTVYGGLYQWNTAMNGSVAQGAQGICPVGFHVPTDTELYTLENFLKDNGQSCDASRGGYGCSSAGTKLRVGGSSGFEALLGGGQILAGSYLSNGTAGYFWSSSEASPTSKAWYRYVTNTVSFQDQVNRNSLDKLRAVSVRCMADSSYTPTSITDAVTLDTAGPTITDSQTGDDTWRNTNNGTYNIDFAETGSGFSNYQMKVTTALAQGGTVLQDWYSVDLTGQSSPYTANWSLPAPVWNNMQQGTNYVSIKAVDLAGNSNTTNDVFYVKKDTQAPTVGVSYSTGIQTSTTISLTPSANDVQSGVNTQTMQYQEVDLTNGSADFSAAPWVTTPVANSFTGTTGKAYKFHLMAVDTATNSSSYSDPGSNWIGIDSTAPMATISYASGAQNSTTITLTKAGQDSQSALTDYDIEYKEANLVANNADFIGATWQEVGGTDGNDQAVTTFTGTSGKAYMFRYRVKNGANTWGSGTSEPGGVNTYYAPANWAGVDTGNPTGTITVNEAHNIGPFNYVKTPNLTITLNTADTGGSNLTSYELSDTDGPWGANPVAISGSSYTNATIPWTIVDTEDNYTKYVQFKDNAGNTYNTSITITYDKTTPQAAVVTSPADDWWQQNQQKTFGWVQSPSSDVDHYELIIDGTVVNANIPSTNSNIIANIPNQKMNAWLIRTYDLALNYTDSNVYHIGWDQIAPSKLLMSNFTFTASSDINGKVTATWPVYADTSGLGSPAQSYTIEKIRDSFADHSNNDANILTQNWAVIANADYYSVTVNDNTPYDFNARALPGDASNPAMIDDAIPYVFRIKVSDSAGNTSGFLVHSAGMSYDTKAPTDPTNVTAVVNGNFSVHLAWTHSDDPGVGVTGYKIYRRALTDSTNKNDFILVGYYDLATPGSPVDPEYDDNDANNLNLWNDTINGVSTTIKGSTSPKLNDSTDYFYRITAIDANGNESEVITMTDPASPPQVVTSVNEAGAQLSDVTDPQPPTNLSGAAVGLDGLNDESDPKQRVDLSWDPATDPKAAGRVPTGTGSGINGYTLYWGKGTAGNPPASYSEFTPVDKNATNYSVVRLDDTSWYYFKFVATDVAGLTSADSEVFAVVTGSSAKPTSPTTVTVNSVKGDPVDDVNVGHKVNVAFIGSKIKDNVNYIDGYKVYRSTTNWNQASDWLNPAKATRLPDITGLNIPGDTLDLGAAGCPLLEKDPITHEQVRSRCFTDTVPNDATTYYYKIRAVGNNSTIQDEDLSDSLANTVFSPFSLIGNLHTGWDTVPDVTSPDLPGELKVKDIHDDGMNFKRNIITWARITTPTRNGANDFSEYKLYRSTDGVTWGQILDQFGNNPLKSNDSNLNYAQNQEISLATNYYMDLIPINEANRYYYYYVTATDDAGTNYYYASPNENTIVNEFSNESNPPDNPDGSVVSVSLNPAIAVPSILNQPGGLKANLVSVGVSSAAIHWTTDQSCDAMVRFRRAGSNDNYREIGEGASTLGIGMSTDHIVNLFGLLPNTAYEYQIISSNFLGNPATAQGVQLPTLTTSGFNITYLPDKLEKSTMSIKMFWNTNMPSNTNIVEYKLTGGDQSGSTAEDAIDLAGIAPADQNCANVPGLCNHTVTVAPLRSSSEYTFRIRAISLDGYVTESSLLSFNTSTADTRQFTMIPASSNVADKNITATTAQIVWQTAVPTTAVLKYGTASGGETLSAIDNVLSTSHVIKLEGLTPGTVYYYYVEVTDINKLTYKSPEYSFRAILKPKISNFRIQEVKPYSVSIAWETNVDTETIINWGTSTAYGEKKGNNDMVKAHMLNIENLMDNTEYHMQIVAHDESGNEVVDEDRIIRTPLDTQGPIITGVKTDILPIGADESSASIIVSWQTDKPGTTLVEYDEGIIGGKYGQRSIEDKSLNTSHTVILKDLKPAASYHFKIVSKDKRGNIGQSPDHTFVTPTKEKSILQLILKSLEETFSWTKNIGKFFGNVFNRIKGK